MARQAEYYREPREGAKSFFWIERNVVGTEFTTAGTEITQACVAGKLLIDDAVILRDGGTIDTATNVGLKIVTADGYGPSSGRIFEEVVSTTFGANKAFRMGAPATAAGGWGGGSQVALGKLVIPIGAKVVAYGTGSNGGGAGLAKVLLKLVRLGNRGFIRTA